MTSNDKNSVSVALILVDEVSEISVALQSLVPAARRDKTNETVPLVSIWPLETLDTLHLTLNRVQDDMDVEKTECLNLGSGNGASPYDTANFRCLRTRFSPLPSTALMLNTSFVSFISYTSPKSTTTHVSVDLFG